MKRRNLLEKYYNQVENQYYERSTYTFYDVYSVSIGGDDGSGGGCCCCIIACIGCAMATNSCGF